MRYIIVADSFDKPNLGCTTHFISLLSLYLLKNGFDIPDPPMLIRHNPAIPWKTRGNASVRIDIKTDDISLLISKVKEFMKLIERVYEGGYLAILREGNYSLQGYYKSISEVLDPEQLRRKVGNMIVFEDGEPRAGALAAYLTPPTELKNFELIVYGYRETSLPEEVCKIICDLEMALWPLIHENCHNERCVAYPKGGKPVLIGIRGSEPCVLASLLPIIPYWEHATLFKTNQHSLTHASLSSRESYLYEFKSVPISGEVRRVGEDVLVAGYRLYKESGITKPFKGGEFFKGFASILFKPGASAIASLSGKLLDVSKKAPSCPKCGGKMKSKGRGIRVCKRCGYRGFVPSKISVDYTNLSLVPIVGRKLHLVGEYRGSFSVKCPLFYINVGRYH